MPPPRCCDRAEAAGATDRVQVQTGASVRVVSAPLGPTPCTSWIFTRADGAGGLHGIHDFSFGHYDLNGYYPETPPELVEDVC